MKAVMIQGHMDAARFSIPGWNGKRGETYPLPPFSTIAGMIHHLCQWDGWHEMKISVAGNGVMNKPEICMRWRGGAVAGSETEEFKQRFPVRVKSGGSFIGWVNTPIYESMVSDLDLRLHIMPENQDEVDVIYKKILNPRTFPSLGRHEDLIRIDDAQIVDILPAQETTLDMCTYAPAAIDISGTVYKVHKDYTINRGKRIFNDIIVKYLDKGMTVVADRDSQNNPCFFE